MKLSLIGKIFVAVLAVLLSSIYSFSDVPARVKLVNASSTQDGMLRWKPVSKVYVFTTKAKNGQSTERELKPSDIEAFRVAKPAGWDDIVKSARSNPSSAASRFEKIAEEYTMLEYDVEAAKYAGLIYLGMGNAEAALKICEKVAVANPEASSLSDMAPVYWKAMLATGKTAKLNGYIDTAIASGTDSAAAQALIIRGDMLKKDGRLKDALKDGYLRTILLFSRVEEAQPEALAKAVETFEELNQATYAERMRQMLLLKYGNSKEAQALRGN